MDLAFAGPKTEVKNGSFLEKDLQALSAKYGLSFSMASSMAEYIAKSAKSSREQFLFEYLMSKDFQFSFANFARHVIFILGNPSRLENVQKADAFVSDAEGPIKLFTLDVLSLLRIKPTEDSQVFDFAGQKFKDQYYNPNLPQHWSNDEKVLDIVDQLKFSEKNPLDKQLLTRLIKIIDRAKYFEFPICDIADPLTAMLITRIILMGSTLESFIRKLLPIAQANHNHSEVLSSVSTQSSKERIRLVNRRNMALAIEA